MPWSLGRKFAALTEPGERVGVLLPNVNAAAVVFFALQAFGRVPAMLNFSAGPANLEAAVVTAADQAGRSPRASSSPRPSSSRRSPPSAATPSSSGSRTCAARSPPRDRLRGLWDGLFAAPHPPAAAACRRDDPAVVLFTSGSEGRPKGVVLSHGNILANCAQISARVDFNQLDKVFNALPVFHSFGLTGAMLLPILGGVAVYMYPSPLHYRIVPELVYDSNATIIFGTNSFLKGYGRAWATRTISAPCATPSPVPRRSRTRPRSCGSTSSACASSPATAPPRPAPVLSLNTPMHYRWGTVGRLLPGIEHRLEPVAGLDRGGRLWVKGPNVMLGYLRYEQPGVLQPPEDGWYDTGDIVDLDARGLRHHPRPRQALRQDRRRDGEPGCGRGLRPPPQPRRTAHAVVALPDPRKGERIVLVTTDQSLDRDAPAQGRARGRRQRADAPGRGPAPPRPAAAGDGQDGLSRACRRS